MTEPAAQTARLSPWWRHATILVMIGGFSVLTGITVLTYTNAPPIPKRVTDASGTTLFDEQAILHGQEVFLKYGLMEHGTLWGHGAYLGPDYTAEYTHRLAETCRAALARERTARSSGDPSPEDLEAATPLTARLLKQNRYDPATGTLVFSRVLARATTRLPDGRHVPCAGVGPHLRRHHLPRRGCAADPHRQPAFVEQARCAAGLRGNKPVLEAGPCRRAVDTLER